MLSTRRDRNRGCHRQWWNRLDQDLRQWMRHPQRRADVAVTSHATSKITDAEELFRVGTFGFRGEALASIAEISQFVLRSRVADSDCGYELIVNGGNAEPVAACGMPTGTIIEVRNLFFNTPVRRKFLKPRKQNESCCRSIYTSRA